MSCVWPEHDERRERLRSAIDLALSEPPRVRKGDLTVDLPAVLREIPADAQLVVFHSAVLVYVPPDRRSCFVQAPTEESLRRPILWLSNESAGILDSIPSQATSLKLPEGLLKHLGRTRLENGRRESKLLAIGHFHGAELEWLDS